MQHSGAGRRRSGSLRGVQGGLPWFLVITLAVAGSATTVPAAQEALTRFPTLHGNTIVFEAAGNLWRVARTGGLAQRLTTDGGFDLMPRFSPDGTQVAFTGQYDGNTDVYLIPAEGGPAKRLTFHSDAVKEAPTRWGPDNMVVTWTPDGKSILTLSRRNTINTWFGQLFLVPREGGLASQFPVPMGGMTSFSPDGTRIAYNRIFRNFRTWKGYYGGLAQDVWIYDLKTHDIQRVTDWKGTDTFPMWYGETIYFASDRGADKRLNIWAYDLKTKQFRQVTEFKDFDVDWPSLGDSGIVFQCGGALYVLDLPGEQLHRVEVTVRNDGLRTRPRWVDASKSIQSFDVAPNGKRALFEARGEVFTVPAEHGNTRDLTQTSGAREQYPAWSPDGTRVAFITDRSGEAQVAMRLADGSGEETLLSERTSGYLYGPVWSPDSEKLAFSDSDHALWYLEVKSRKATRVDQDPRQEIHQFAWSPDGLWLTYVKAGDNDLGVVYLFGLASGSATRVSDGQSNDYEPVFDPEGKYLYFVSNRHENAVFSESELSIATVKMGGIFVATLRADEPSPFAPRSDEGAPKPDQTEEKTTPWKPGAIPAIRVDLDGLMRRALAVPVPAGEIDSLAAAKGRLYYLTTPVHSFESPLPGEKAELHLFDMAKRKDEVLVSPLDAFVLSADGDSVLYRDKERWVIAGALKKQPPTGGDGEEGPHVLDLAHVQALVDPAAEWAEMLHQAWRLERDLFYNPRMNGIDWPAMRARYETLLPGVSCREDLNYVLGEMLGELHNSHTYVGGGDAGQTARVPVGLLGVDFALDAGSGRYTFSRIYPGDNSREGYRSPLTEPGVDVKQGDTLLAVDGHDLRSPTDPYSPFVNTVERTVTLTVASSPDGKGKRDVTVRPVESELNLRLKAWIDHNRDEVDRASGGKIGYVYLSDMDEEGLNQFISQFYAQIRKQGLVVDVRWNGGGFIDQVVLERLRRVLVGMSTNRSGVPFPIPPQVLHGPMVCLANHYSASDGDIFPYFFKKYGLGPVVGERTWGGVRGIRGFWPLADGGYVTIPEDSIYGLDSQWVIENYGVEPDVEVDDLPGDVMAGRDAQLETAIRIIMDRLKDNPVTLPERPPLLPAYPPQGR